MQTLTAPEWTLMITALAVLAGMGIAACLHILRHHPWTARLTADQPTGINTLMVLVGLVWLGLFGLTVWAAYLGIWQSIHPDPATTGSGQTPFGLGALLVALLGAPFLVWNSVIKQTTLNFQKDGHITDRISKAVEQSSNRKNETGLHEITRWFLADLADDQALFAYHHPLPNGVPPYGQ
jgi:hypothetical protein